MTEPTLMIEPTHLRLQYTGFLINYVFVLVIRIGTLLLYIRAFNIRMRNCMSLQDAENTNISKKTPKKLIRKGMFKRSLFK